VGYFEGSPRSSIIGFIPGENETGLRLLTMGDKSIEPRSVSGDKAVLDFDFAPDGQTVALVKDDTVEIWNVETASFVRKVFPTPVPSSMIHVLPGFDELYSDEEDGMDDEVDEGDEEDGEEAEDRDEFEGFTPHLVRYSARGNVLAISSECDDTGLARIIAINSQTMAIQAVIEAELPIHDMALSEDGTSIVFIPGWMQPIIFDLRSMKHRRVHEEDPNCTHLALSGKLIAMAIDMEDEGVSGGLYSFPGLKEKADLDKDESGKKCIAFSSDGDVLYTGDQKWHMKIWDARKGKLFRSIDISAEHRIENLDSYGSFEAGINSIAASPDGRFLAASWLDKLQAWELTREDRPKRTRI
jgi:WD40 repeat protein